MKGVECLRRIRQGIVPARLILVNAHMMLFGASLRMGRCRRKGRCVLVIEVLGIRDERGPRSGELEARCSATPLAVSSSLDVNGTSLLDFSSVSSVCSVIPRQLSRHSRE